MEMRSLETSDVKVARDKRDILELEVRKAIQEAQSGSSLPPATLSMMERGRNWREALSGEVDEDQRELITDLAADYSESIKSAEDRQAFDAGWIGMEAVDAYVEDWLGSLRAGSSGFAEKTINEKRGLIRQFTGWSNQNKLMLPQINRKTAGEYVAERIENRHRATAKKHITALIGYWDYLLRRGKITGNNKTDNPWTDQLERGKRKQGVKEDMQDERPFSDAELIKLLCVEGKRKHDHLVRELALISVLSGMRIAEITSLTVANCKDGKIEVSKSKTAAGVRTLPIHSMLKSVFARRMEGKQDSELIFHELIRMRNAADTLGKAFYNRRKDFKIDEKLTGRRRSLVNFHSFRRTFITKARHAGFQESTIADIVGHDTGRKTMTFGVYTHGASWEQKQECVEAVLVPEITIVS